MITNANIDTNIDNQYGGGGVFGHDGHAGVAVLEFN